MKIKFRAWDEGNEVMHHDFQFIQTGDEGNDWIIFISDKFPLHIKDTNPFENPNPYFSQQLKKMQYTGLEDKNDVEIYEGDIAVIAGKAWLIKITSYGALGSRIDGGMDNWNITEWADEMEIIGNIYENPELLD